MNPDILQISTHFNVELELFCIIAFLLVKVYGEKSDKSDNNYDYFLACQKHTTFVLPVGNINLFYVHMF